MFEIVWSTKPNFCARLVAIYVCWGSVVYVLTNVRRAPNYKRQFASLGTRVFESLRRPQMWCCCGVPICIRLRRLLVAGSKVRLNYNPGNAWERAPTHLPTHTHTHTHWTAYIILIRLSHVCVCIKLTYFYVYSHMIIIN